MTLGIFWNGQQAQLNSFSRSDRHLSWIHIAFLFAVSIMPFSTRLLAGFISYRSVLIAYWANILLLGVVLYVSWRYADASGSAAGRDYPREAMRGGTQNRRGPGPLCLRSLPLPVKHLRQHCFHRPGPAQLRPGAAAALSVGSLAAHSRSDSTMCTPGGAVMAASSRALAILSAGTTR